MFTGKKISAIIVDDEQSSINLLDEALQYLDEIELLGTITNPEKALDFILIKNPDIVFLDIQMPNKSGFDIAKEIRQLQSKSTIIFVTAYDRFAIQAIKFAAFDYLLKPVKESDLIETITRYKQEERQQSTDIRIDRLLNHISRNRKIRFNTRTGFILLDTSDILYCEADRNYSTIYLGNERKEVVSMNLGAVEKILPDNVFFRINRFVIVNLDYLLKVERKERKCFIKLDGDVISFKIPVKQIKLLENLL